MGSADSSVMLAAGRAGTAFVGAAAFGYPFGQTTRKMLGNYLIVALRSMRRNVGTTLMHVSGLGVGLAVAFFIMAWVDEERSYDRFHEAADRLYQVLRVRTEENGSSQTSRNVTAMLAEALEQQYPAVERHALLSWEESFLVARGEESARVGGYHAGPAFFRMFSFPLVVGDPDEVLASPDAIAISERTAERFFGPEWRSEPDLVGSTLRVDERRAFTVSGVFENVPNVSTLQFDAVLPFADFAALNPWVWSWGNNGPQLFVELVPGTDGAALSEDIADLVSRNRDRDNTTVFLQSVRDMRLWTTFEGRVATGGRVEYVRLLSLAALLILVIACINFANLATARSARRAREIGIRKSIGGTRGGLVRQFLGESVLIAVVAGVFASALVALLAPMSESLTGKGIGPATVGGELWVLFAVVTLACGVVSGIYPALILSGMASSDALRRARGATPKGSLFRQGLVVVQFAVSVVMLLAAFSIRSQIDYIRRVGPGYEREGLATVLVEGDAQARVEEFAANAELIPGIAALSFSDHHPLSVNQGTSDPVWPGKDPDDDTSFTLFRGGRDLAQTLGIPLVAGRYLSSDREDDRTNFLVNETAARLMGLEDPVGTNLAYWGREGQIVGLLQDFHFTDFYRAIEPVIVGFDDGAIDYLVVRIEPGMAGTVIPAIGELYGRYSPAFPFEYTFLDEAMEDDYVADRQIGRLAVAFTLVALFISLVGLLGIALHATERRAREIGVRKVLGATVPSIVGLFSLDLLRPVAVAMLLGVPLGWIVVRAWLDRYAYHTDPLAEWFVAAPLVLILAGFLAVFVSAGRAASASPVTSLRRVE